MAKDAIVLFAHGSQDPNWAVPFERVKAIIERERANLAVRVSYLEIMRPTLLQTIDELHGEGITHISIIPMFLAPGAHVARDLPQLFEQAKRMYPSVTLRLLSSLGEVDALLEAIGCWIASKTRSKNRG